MPRAYVFPEPDCPQKNVCRSNPPASSPKRTPGRRMSSPTSRDARRGRVRSSHPSTDSVSARTIGELVEREPVAVEDDTVASGEGDAEVGRVGDLLGDRGDELRAFDPGGLDRMHLTEAPVDGGVAAGLQHEVVDRALEREAPAVDRGRNRGDRGLELAPARRRSRRHAGDCLGFPRRAGGDLTGSRSACPTPRSRARRGRPTVARRGASGRCRARTTCSRTARLHRRCARSS